ncbi:hypothetical protein [Saccharopolyspora sp. ASAGF58]|nr:hypothetical protein [Saccharopolyspora sp. ASAGF58]
MIFHTDDGDNDPHGLVYVRPEDEAAVRTGFKQPSPLALHASAGE